MALRNEFLPEIDGRGFRQQIRQELLVKNINPHAGEIVASVGAIGRCVSPATPQISAFPAMQPLFRPPELS